MGPAIEAKAPNFSQPKHSLNAEQPSLSAGSIVYRFPLFHSSYGMRGIVMNASRVPGDSASASQNKALQAPRPS
jgi:hypothetical protein